MSIENAYSNNSLKYIRDEINANKETAEIYLTHKRKYLNLTLIFQLDNDKNLKKLTVRGSIHTLFNNGVHNANTFTFNDFKTTLERFSKDLGIDLTRCVFITS